MYRSCSGTIFIEGMRIKVHRNLDMPLTVFGIKGVFIGVFLICTGIVILLSLIVGSIWSVVTAITFFLSGMFASFLGVSLVQGRFKPVILTRLLNSLSFPEYIIIKEKPWKRRLK